MLRGGGSAERRTATGKPKYPIQCSVHILNKEVKLLYSADQNYRWKPLTHELIPFHLWLEAKIQNKPYKFYIWPELQEWLDHQKTIKRHDHKFADMAKGDFLKL